MRTRPGGDELSLRLDECEVPRRHSKDGKQTIHKYMGLELSGEIKTADKNCESSENMCDMEQWGWMRSPGREVKLRKAEGLGPPTFNLWGEDEPTKEKDKEQS